MQFEGEFVNDCNWTFTINFIENPSANNTTELSLLYVNNGNITAGFALLFFLVGLPWNALVIGIILKKKLFTHPTYMLMLNLTIANLLVCVLVLPLFIVTGFIGRAMLKENI